MSEKSKKQLSLAETGFLPKRGMTFRSCINFSVWTP